jgi:flagellar hook-basal body complex protein FliE
VSTLGPIAPLPSMPFGPMGASGVRDAAGATEAAAAPAASGFGDMLAGAIAGLNSQMVGSERLSEQAATGGLADPTVALVAVEEADLAFNTAVQVRNKLVEGWQELSRMSV